MPWEEKSHHVVAARVCDAGGPGWIEYPGAVPAVRHSAADGYKWLARYEPHGEAGLADRLAPTPCLAGRVRRRR